MKKLGSGPGAHVKIQGLAQKKPPNYFSASTVPVFEFSWSKTPKVAQAKNPDLAVLIFWGARAMWGLGSVTVPFWRFSQAKTRKWAPLQAQRGSGKGGGLQRFFNGDVFAVRKPENGQCQSWGGGWVL